MHSDTEPALLERLRNASDPLAWEEFFDRYWRLIYAYAKRRDCSDNSAEEIVQDVMLTVYQKRGVFCYDSSRGRFRSWLGGVVRNHVSERRRKPSERIRAVGGNEKDDLEQFESREALPDDLWEAHFENSVLAILLDMVRREFSPETYQAFELVTWHRLSGEEVAKIVGISRNAVYLARRRVLGRMKELGATYRDEGQLDRKIKEALELRPSPAEERSVTSRIHETMRSR